MMADHIIYVAYMSSIHPFSLCFGMACHVLLPLQLLCAIRWLLSLCLSLRICLCVSESLSLSERMFVA